MNERVINTNVHFRLFVERQGDEYVATIPVFGICERHEEAFVAIERAEQATSTLVRAAEKGRTTPPAKDQNTAADFILKYLPEAAVGDFKALSDEDRLKILERLGEPCGLCGQLGERRCYIDPDDY